MNVSPDVRPSNATLDSKGIRRLAYFYTHGESIVCPPCSESVVERDPGFSVRVEAHYTADRLYICASCGIYIGPLNAEEMES